jgi:hypothetical protein
MIHENGTSSGLITEDTTANYGAPVPVREELYDSSPPVGELGSSFDYNTPFGSWWDDAVYTPSDPSLQDYHHMLDTDGTAASIELLLSYPIVSAAWSIEPAKGDTGQAEFIYDALTALPHQGGPMTTVEQLVAQMTSAFTNKRAYFEKVFKVNADGRVVYHKLAYRPPETCELALDARTAEPRGFRQMPIVYPGGPGVSGEFSVSNPFVDSARDRSGWVRVPSNRAFVYVHGAWRDPLLGVSALKTPYYCYLTKRKLRWLWYQFLDQTALPKTIVKNQDEIQARNDARKIATLRGRSIVALNAETSVEPYESAGHGAQYFQDALSFLDGEMLNAGLMGFLQLTVRSATGRGSYALATTMEQLYNRSRVFVALDMARQITNEVIGPLIAYNFGPMAPVPRFKFGPLSGETDQLALNAFQQIMAAQNANVPVEFYDELIARVAAVLNLDPGKVAKDMEVNGSPQSNSLELLGAQVEQARQMVIAARQGNAAGVSGKAASPGAAKSGNGSGTSGNSGGHGTNGNNGSVGKKEPTTVGTRPFGATSVANPGRQNNKNYGH